MTSSAQQLQPQIKSTTIPFLAGRRGRILRENLTAYIMIIPAVGLILTFALFPVAFAVFVSMHRWRIKMGDFSGFDNYVRAVDNLAYVTFLGIALGAAVGTFIFVRRLLRTAREAQEQPWLFLIPGAALAAGIIQLIRWAVALTPELLGVADKIVGLEKTRELFQQLLGEAFRAAAVWQLMTSAIIFLLADTILAVVVNRRQNSENGSTFILLAMTIGILIATAILMGSFTIREMMVAVAEILAEGETPLIWAQTLSISAGFALLVAAWFLWSSAERDDAFVYLFLRLLGAISLLIGGWILIGELPLVIGAGDEDVWEGLRVTAWYSFTTVPLQLSLGLLLAVLLYQNLRGKDFFRIVFFLPYVTPAVASAGVFRVMFSNRPAAPVNQLFAIFGRERQDWLLEPEGVFRLLTNALGIDAPSWFNGPSLALVVIIIYNTWVFTGYYAVIYMAGLGNIPKETEDAASIDGAGAWQVFRYITFPLLSPTTYFLSLLGIIGTFKAFNHVWVMRNPAALGTTDTFSIVIYTEFFEKSRFGYASALAFVLFGVILALTLVNNRIQGSKVFYG